MESWVEINHGEKCSPSLQTCTLLNVVRPPLFPRTLWQLLRELASTVSSCVGAHMAHSLSLCDAILSAEGPTDTPDSFHSLLSLTQDFGDKVRPAFATLIYCSKRMSSEGYHGGRGWPVVLTWCIFARPYSCVCVYVCVCCALCVFVSV